MTTGPACVEHMANMGRRLIRSHKYRLYPNGAQEAAHSDMLGHFRDLCNAGLQQRIEAWRRRGHDGRVRAVVLRNQVGVLPEAVACALVLDNDGVVQEPVEEGGGDDGLRSIASRLFLPTSAC